MIEISAENKEILIREIGNLMIPLSTDSPTYHRTARLLSSLEAGTVSDDLIPVLEQVLELFLSSRRIRDAYGPQEEQRMTGLYFLTPAGSTLQENLRHVNDSLNALKNHRLVSLSFSSPVPGVYRMELATDQCRLTFSIDWHSVSINKLSVEL